MTEILRNLNQEEIAIAIENNRTEVYKDMWLRHNAKVKKTKEYSLYSTGYKASVFNGVIDTNIEEKEVEEKIEEVISFFDKQKLPFRWLTGSTTKPRKIYKKLEEKGFKLDRVPGMALSLKQIKREHPSIPNLTIINVKKLDEAEKFAKVSQIIFGIPEEFTMMSFKRLEHDSASIYVAMLDGEPVGISAVYYYCGVAGIYLVGVLEKARKKGIGSAITFAPLYDAKDKGFEWAVLHSSELGFNVYKRMGFEEYCKDEICTWIPKH